MDGMLVGIQEKPVSVIAFVVKQVVSGGRRLLCRSIIVWLFEEYHVSSISLVSFLDYFSFGRVFALGFQFFARDSMLLVSLLEVQDCWKLHNVGPYV